MWRAIIRSPSGRFVAACVVLLSVEAFFAWTHVARQQKHPTPRACESIHVLCVARRIMQDQMEKIWPEPHAALIASILYGARTNVPRQLKEQFNTVGITHVMAVSGYNVTIIANLVMILLRSVGVRRKRAFGFVALMVAVFVLFVGASASAVRAGIMGMVALLGKTLGRGSSRAPVLCAAAVLMTMMNPDILIADAGFHLSMLATIGLLYAGAPIERRLYWVPERFGLREMLATTIAATLLTFPYISMVFGRVSLVSLLANTLIVPVVPVLMATAAIAVIAGILGEWVGVALGVFAWFVSTYIISVVGWLAQVPFASISLRMSLGGMVACYSVIFLWLLRENKASHSFLSAPQRL